MAAARALPLTLAEVTVDVLRHHGVERIFGIPGGGSSLALIEAADRAGIEFVLTRTETAAAIMAAVTGELSGTPGVMLAGIGPGAASAVNGIAYAHLERAPVVLFTDGPASSLHQAIDQNALYRPITKTQGRLHPANGRADMEAAVQAAMTPPWGPVHLDLTATDAAEPVTDPGRPAPAVPGPAIDADALERARGILAKSRRPVLLVGLEARHGDGPAAVARLADALSCPVMPTYKAKGVPPDAHPGVIGMFTGAMAEAPCLESADLIIAIGLDPVEIIPGDWRYDAPMLDLTTAPGPYSDKPVPPECRVVGPLADIVDALLTADSKADWTPTAIEALAADMRARLALGGVGHTAETVVRAVSDAAPEGCRATIDAGAHMFSAFAWWTADRAFGVLKSNGLSTMGFALPAAIASALEEPDRPVVAITGDGGLMMCLAELTTAVERGCAIVVVVLNDAALSLIDIKQQRQQRKSLGVRYPAVDFAAVAEALGCRAWRVGADDPLSPILGDVFSGGGSALMDVTVDPGGYGDQLAALRG